MVGRKADENFMTIKEVFEGGEGGEKMRKCVPEECGRNSVE